jgi:hypothetical protein
MLCIRPIYLLVADKSSKTCSVQGGAKSVQFLAPALGDEFDAAIGEVADGAGDVEAGGDRFGGVPETHPLHMAVVKNGHTTEQSVGGGRRHMMDEAKGAPAMQLFSSNFQQMVIFF